MDFFKNLDWILIKDWFLAQGIWLLVTLAVAALVYRALRRWLPKGVKAVFDRITPVEAKEEMKKTIHIITQVLLWLGTLIIVAAMVLGVLPQFGVDISSATRALAAAGASIGTWLGTHGVRILIIVVLAIAAHQVLKRLIPRVLGTILVVAKEKRRRVAMRELKKRSETLSSFLVRAAIIVIWVTVGFMILSELGVNIAPLLAGAGVAGIAIGFGAQSLIRDLIAGFFVILENQYNVGDVIRVGNIAGGVEELNIRRTILRDLDGARHIIPNGEIRTVSNLTQEWSRAHLNISVAYKEDLDRVMAIMRKTWEEMAEDPNWSPFMLSKTPWLLRVDEFGDSGITIKMVGETQPIKQWDVMGEFRRRIKRIFDDEGIEIPWPHTKLYLGDNAALDFLAKYGAQLPLVSGRVGMREGEENVPVSNRRRVSRKRAGGRHRRDSSGAGN